MIQEPNIASAIAQLRDQLIQAMEEGEGKSIRFLPTSVEIELSLVFNAAASAGIKAGGFWSILELSGSGQVSSENTHKVKLTLEPVELVEGVPYSQGEHGGKTYFVAGNKYRPPVIQPAANAQTDASIDLEGSGHFGTR